MNKEFKSIKKDADAAVLLLHGILGTPRHFDFLLPLLPEGWSKWAILLPGHGGSVRDFSRSSMEKWKAAVESAMQELSESHERVYIVGHSMGTLLAVHAAKKFPGKVSGIFALAMPLRIRFSPRALRTCLHTAFRKPESDTPFQRVCRKACSVSLSKNPLSYIGWIPRYLELFALSREIRKAMTTLESPCTAIQSACDELVSPASLECMGKAKALALPDSSHYFYSEADRKTIENEFKKFIQA